MVDLYQVADELSTHQCKIHNQKITATVTGDYISLSGCCQDFINEMEKLMNEKITEGLPEADNDNV